MTPEATVLVATGTSVLRLAPDSGVLERSAGLDGVDPTCLAADPSDPGRAWCGSRRSGVYRSDDRGASWRAAGLETEHVTALAACPSDPGTVWAGTEPSALWCSSGGDGGWERAGGLRQLPSADAWSFPPRPETDHVRWIACRPDRAGHLWLAIEAGALVTTPDGGRSWRDRVPGGPRDTHELAIHPARPETLRVAAGNGYFESRDGGATWERPRSGLEIDYMRSVAVHPEDPETVVASGASRPRSAYVAGPADGCLYRRSGAGRWRRVTDGWPGEPETIAPLLHAGAGALWAADERGVHRSVDGGRSWARMAPLEPTPSHLRGLVVLSSPTR